MATRVQAASTIDLSQAVVVVPTNASVTEQSAVRMFIEEVQKRTQLRLPAVDVWPDAALQVIAFGQAHNLHVPTDRFADVIPKDAEIVAPESYRVCVRRDDLGVGVFVVGNDERGELFGVGRLLRSLSMRPGQLELADDLNLTSAPAYSLRGHQLGYRPKTNSYDAWDLPQWEQYYRDLIVFGANAVELLPPRTDDAETSPHFPRPPMEMMVGMSQLAADYGLDVWIWYPAMDEDYADRLTLAKSLVEWNRVFEQLPRIDAVFVPGGDPGHTPPAILMSLLEKQARMLRRSHPEAEMWVSPQSFSQAWLDEFLEILRRDQPAWLTGVVFGPQVRISLADLRAAAPERYPLRHYPDITHSRQCQYPAPDWDVAFAVTHGRECINPRPLGQATIFRQLQQHTIGFLTYSEGCNDDVNKAVWSGLGWDPSTPVIDILRDYSNYFIGERYRDDFAQGLLALERNWQGPVASNAQIESTLAQFQAMEREAAPVARNNWRFQQALYRAYYDAHVRRRLLHETECEARAMDYLRDATTTGSLAAMSAAEGVLEGAAQRPVAGDMRDRVFELGDALYESIGMQASVGRHQAIAVGRGATLDTMDAPLNNRLWLKDRFAAVRLLESEPARLKALQEIINWTNPGPGGFYDDLGNAARQPHLIVGPGFENDPAFLVSAHAGFAGPSVPADSAGITQAWRFSWQDHAESMNDEPLTLRYADLDPAARYKVRVVYAGDGPRKLIRLTANDGIEIHPLITKPTPVAPIEFAIPAAATQGGELNLQWHREHGLGDNGRGCQVAEVWLIKER